jgi:hypothetical protein
MFDYCVLELIDGEMAIHITTYERRGSKFCVRHGIDYFLSRDVLQFFNETNPRFI